MQLVSSLLFGVSASLDALLVGVSYGLRNIHFKAIQNLFISTVTLLGTCLSVNLGSILTPLLPSPFGGCIGSCVLILLGIYYISKWSLSSLKDRAKGRPRRSRPERPAPMAAAQVQPRLYVTEILLLSLTLSANNLGIGLSASMAGLGLAPAATATFVCSVLFLYIGNCLGRCRLLQTIGGLADPISGLLLIGLGLIQLFL